MAPPDRCDAIDGVLERLSPIRFDALADETDRIMLERQGNPQSKPPELLYPTSILGVPPRHLDELCRGLFLDRIVGRGFFTGDFFKKPASG